MHLGRFVTVIIISIIIIIIVINIITASGGRRVSCVVYESNDIRRALPHIHRHMRATRKQFSCVCWESVTYLD